MSDTPPEWIAALLRRQAEWQRSRRALSWPEKIEMSLKLREAARALRAGKRDDPNPEA